MSCTVKLVAVKLKQDIILSVIFVFVIQHYNLMVGVDFSLIGHDPKVSLLLAGITMSLADDLKGL